MRRTTFTAGQQTHTRRRQIKAGNRANQSSISQSWQLRYTAEPNFDSRNIKDQGPGLDTSATTLWHHCQTVMRWIDQFNRQTDGKHMKTGNIHTVTETGAGVKN